MNCYILTGGRSIRMGRSKSELFLDRVVVAAAPVFESVIAVERAGGADLSIPTIHEQPHTGEGPVFGVERALEHAWGRCFVIATDYPLLTPDLLRELRRRFEACPAPMFVPVWRGIPQTLCAGYSADLLPLVRKRIAEGRLDLKGLMTEAGAVRVDVMDGALRNVNTPEELAQAEIKS